MFNDFKEVQTLAATGQFIHGHNYRSVSPQGYSTGIGINAGVEYKFFKGMTLGGQITSCILYNHNFGKSESRSVSKTPPFQENVTVNSYFANTNVYNISPLNYTLSARYYF